MAHYVDGFVIPLARRKLAAYLRMARFGARLWKKHGALEYRECSGDDLAVKMGLPFPRDLRAQPGETIIFSWIVFKSRAHRDRVNAKVMGDPSMAKMERKTMPFDPRRMLYGGFKIRVEA